MARSKTRTLADMLAAAKLKGIDPATITVVSAEDAERAALKAAADAAAASMAPTAQPSAAPIDPTEHRCGIPGCRHGAVVNGAHVTQPDRQVKLSCTRCGAVARMTHGALTRAGGMPTCADGAPFVIAPRRTYNRRHVAAAD